MSYWIIIGQVYTVLVMIKTMLVYASFPQIAKIALQRRGVEETYVYMFLATIFIPTILMLVMPVILWKEKFHFFLVYTQEEVEAQLRVVK